MPCLPKTGACATVVSPPCHTHSRVGVDCATAVEAANAKNAKVAEEKNARQRRAGPKQPFMGENLHTEPGTTGGISERIPFPPECARDLITIESKKTVRINPTSVLTAGSAPWPTRRCSARRSNGEKRKLKLACRDRKKGRPIDGNIPLQYEQFGSVVVPSNSVWEYCVRVCLSASLPEIHSPFCTKLPAYAEADHAGLHAYPESADDCKEMSEPAPRL